MVAEEVITTLMSYTECVLLDPERWCIRFYYFDSPFLGLALYMILMLVALKLFLIAVRLVIDIIPFW